MLNKILLLLLINFSLTSITHANDQNEIPNLRIKSNDREAIEQSMETTKQLIEKKKGGTTVEAMPAKFDHINNKTHGVPDQVHEAKAEKLILRHFVGTWANEGELLPIEKILKSRTLKVGPVPYAQVSKWYRNMFPDLSGVFFTLPSANPREVGVFGGNFVDFEVYPGTGVVKIEDKIYMVPGEKGFEIPVKVLAWGKINETGKVTEVVTVARKRITQLPKATAKNMPVVKAPTGRCGMNMRYLR